MKHVEQKQFKLKRTGKRPVAFTGTMIAETRTHEARVYRTDAGRYVLEYVVFTTWQGQEDAYHVHVAESVDDLARILECDVAPRVGTSLIDALSQVEDIAERV